MTQPHRAFVSHASEDKSGFAEPLATQLRSLGVDAWLDKWEMMPGDSLIQKIFSEGIHGTDAVIVLLSRTSVAKPWVQKELNVAAVKNIENAVRLIPVRLDDCEVPTVLRDLIWIDWNREGGAERVSVRITETLHGRSGKPPLGKPPAHLAEPRFSVPGLNQRDVKVLQIIFEAALEHGPRLLQGDVIMPSAEEAGLTFKEVKESVTMLETQGFVTDRDTTIMQSYVIVDLNAGQALRLATSYGHDVESLIKRIVALVCNEQADSLFGLQEALAEVPKGLIEATLEVLSANGFWRQDGTMDGNIHIFDIQPTAVRWLEANS